MRNLLFLFVSVFGKVVIIEGFFWNNFNLCVVNKYGEIVLYFMVMYLYKVVVIIGGKLIFCKDRENIFECLLYILSDYYFKILVVRDNYGCIVLYVFVVNILS